MSKIRTKFTPEVRELSTPVEFCPHPLVGHFYIGGALLHKDLKCKASLIEPNLRRNLGKWAT